MRRRTPVRLEMMEGRLLLSGLSYSLTTDKAVYQAGDTINFTFTETNTSTGPVNVTVAPADFTVTEGLAVVFQSNAGNSSGTPTSAALQPGQSVTQTASWSGMESFLQTEINLWGSFEVSSANAPAVTTAFQIADPLVDGISTNQSVYQVGQPIEITSSATNTSPHPVTVVNIRSLPESFEVSQNGTTIWQGGITGIVVDPLEPPPAYEVATMTIQPGHAATDTVTWDGIPSSNASTVSTVTGSFVASFPGTPGGPTALFQIQSPIQYTIAVAPSTFLGQPGYQEGQPVPITYTETNTSDEPVTVVIKPPDFEISLQYPPAVVWQSAPGAVEAAGITRTLQPGQSITQSATWNDIANQGSLDSASVSNLMYVTNPNGPTGLSATLGSVDEIRSVVTTNQKSYRPGTPVRITLTETNTSDYPVALDPTGTFTVSSLLTGKSVFSENSALTAIPVTLQPGQWLDRTVTWIPTETGTFNFAYQDAQIGYIGINQFQVTKTAPTQSVSPIAVELTPNRQQYREGQAVVLMLTVKNTTSSVVTLTPVAGDGISVLSGSTVVWHSSAGTSRIERRSLAPGKTISLRVAWNGKPNQNELKQLKPGVYAIEASFGGYVATTTIQITS